MRSSGDWSAHKRVAVGAGAYAPAPVRMAAQPAIGEKVNNVCNGSPQPCRSLQVTRSLRTWATCPKPKNLPATHSAGSYRDTT